jgi:hypothetical protein
MPFLLEVNKKSEKNRGREGRDDVFEDVKKVDKMRKSHFPTISISSVTPPTGAEMAARAAVASGVNLNNVLQPAFTCEGPKSAKKTYGSTVFLRFWYLGA